jgi:hypothetical protein
LGPDPVIRELIERECEKEERIRAAVRFAGSLKPDAYDSRWRPLFYPKAVMLALLSGVEFARLRKARTG